MRRHGDRSFTLIRTAADLGELAALLARQDVVSPRVMRIIRLHSLSVCVCLCVCVGARVCVPQICIDMEHHRARSFHGFLCLVQVSTPDDDYLIGDPLPPRT